MKRKQKMLILAASKKLKRAHKAKIRTDVIIALAAAQRHIAAALESAVKNK